MLLDGREMAEYIQERHIRVVRSLRPKPVLAIILAGSDPASRSFVGVKQRYGDEIWAQVQVHEAAGDKPSLLRLIDSLNQDDSVCGIVVQLPLPDPAMTDEIVAAISPAKDIDGLGPKASYDPATPSAILWLLAGYGIDLKDKKILVVGQGRLVGAPLTRMLQRDGHQPATADVHTTDLAAATRAADIIITATGVPGLIKDDMIQPSSIVIDAGTADAAGSLVGDCEPALYERKDIKISPVPGGVGPMTVALLFEHLLRASS